MESNQSKIEEQYNELNDMIKLDKERKNFPSNAYEYSLLQAKHDVKRLKLRREKKVLILYTGGTIGMKKSEEGLRPQKQFLFKYMYSHPNFCDKVYTKAVLNEGNKINEHSFLSTPPSIYNDKRIYYRLLELEEAIDSSNMNLSHWLAIGQIICDNYNEYDAFIILHGTDTMNYTACILSFMLENLNKPVILTGAQIPLI